MLYLLKKPFLCYLSILSGLVVAGLGFNNSSNLGAEIGEKNKDKLYTSNNKTSK